VHRWHGDVDAGRKRHLIQNPSGVLLITPESIESLLLNRTSQIANVFRHLSFVVIDEIHSLVGIERGTHLRSLLWRLRHQTEQDFRLIGLSATLGNAFPVYQDWMRPDHDREVNLIEGSTEAKRLLYKIHGFLSPPPEPDDEDDEAPSLPVGIIEAMYRHFVGKKNLVFANSKSDVEQFADALNFHCRNDGRTDDFLVHHGALSKESREFTEREMQGRRPKTTVCSSTLELGIDIGSVAAVGQVDPPWSVSSLVQRLGRSGRGEGEPQCMRLYITESPITAKSTLIDKLHLDLLRAAAVTELMLERPSWVEPPSIARFDLSTFTHQILSVLAQTGGAAAPAVYATLCTNGAFRSFSTGQFTKVLRCLAAKPPRFFGSGGEIHQRIRQKMKEIVCSDRELQYLDEAAAELLTQSRATAIAARLHETSFVSLSPTRCLWFTWTGTQIQRTLCLLAEQAGLPCTDRDVAIEFESTGIAETKKTLASIASSEIDPVALANLLPSKQYRKLDELLSDELLAESLAVDFLDATSAMEIIKLHAIDVR
jgi:Lhr-like helicase